jgi:phosphodiesterase/alkaline phosphatase D-like protein
LKLLPRYTDVALLLVFITGTSLSGQFHVTSTAGSAGNGSLSSPWQLQVALTQTSAVHGGDTIYVHGGTYVNPTNGQDHVAWTSTISGTSSAPIIVRAWPGDHPALDGANSQQNDILRVIGSNVWFIGLEIYSSSTNRYSPSGGSFPPSSEIDRGTCVGITQDQPISGVKIINCIIHDGFIGYGNTSATSTNAELYGCLLYNNGWFASDRNHGHNIYIQNPTGGVRAQNSNIIWGAFENLVQAYGTQNTDDFSFDQNIAFGPVDGGFLVGGAQVSNNLTMTNNYLYSGIVSSPLLNLGWLPYGAGLANATITGNYVGWGELEFQSPISGNISGNTIYYGALSGASSGDFPNNTWSGSKPTGVKVAVIPNRYEAGRANIAVYNWDKKSTVTVDLSGVFNSGDKYTVIDAQNPSVVVASGTYGGPVTIPMTGLTAVNPIGQGTRTHTAPEFGAFIATGGTGVVVVQAPPGVTTSSAGNITANGAQLNGSVNPNGSNATYHFDYGTSTSYGSSTSSANAGAGTGALSVNATVSGLTPGTLYHFRLVATNGGGKVNGNDQTLTTSAGQSLPPLVTTSSASNITATGGQLNGSVNPNGISTTYHFDFGPTGSYGSSTTGSSAGSGTSATSVSASLSGLSSSTTYHYRLVAVNGAGTTNGSDLTFTTGTAPQASPPTVTTAAASSVTATGARLNGTVNPNGLSASYHFEYGTDTGYGTSTGTASAGSGSSGVSVNATLSGLVSGKVYHYRLVATNSAGTTNGGDRSFTGGSPPPASNPPSVTTSPAGDITSTGGQINGTVTPNGASTAYHVEYGVSSGYGASTQDADAGSGTSPVNVSVVLSGLSPLTTYHYRIVASNTGGTTNGDDSAFSTVGGAKHDPAADPFALTQNYPNPFNPATQIDFVLYVSGEVTLKVFNSLGVEVRTLVSGFQTAGRHSAVWDAKGVPSGIYFCMLKSGGVVSTRRMILIK